MRLLGFVPDHGPLSTVKWCLFLFLFLFGQGARATPLAFEYVDSTCTNNVQLSNQVLKCDDKSTCQPGLDAFITAYGSVTIPKAMSSSSVEVTVRVCGLNIMGVHLLCTGRTVSEVDICNGGLGLAVDSGGGQECPEAGPYTFDFTTELPDEKIDLGQFAGWWGVSVVADLVQADDGTLITTCSAHLKTIQGVTTTIGSVAAAAALVAAAAAALVYRRRRRRVATQMEQNESYPSSFVELKEGPHGLGKMTSVL